MNEILLKEEYYHWLCNIIFSEHIHDNLMNDYSLLLSYLFNYNFQYIMEKDANRYEDGVDLRYEFGYENNLPDVIIANELDCEPCSMLEMLVALSKKCEKIADDPEIGDRTGKWFWMMIDNMGLSEFHNSRFNQLTVERIIEKFLNRDYEKDGRGGLFIIPGRVEDMRYVEIWYQAMWFLNYYLNKRRD